MPASIRLTLAPGSGTLIPAWEYQKWVTSVLPGTPLVAGGGKFLKSRVKLTGPPLPPLAAVALNW